MKRKADPEELNKMLLEGKTPVECARHFGVSRAAISQARKRLGAVTTKINVMERSIKIVGQNLDAMAQLRATNEKMVKILNEKDRALSIQAAREIRGQLLTQLEIFKTMYDMKTVAEFQDEVLEAIGEVAPDVRAAIIRKLKERRALRESANLT